MDHDPSRPVQSTISFTSSFTSTFTSFSGRNALPLSDVPRWLVEGHAAYADYRYSASRPDRRSFLGDRYTPMEDLAAARADGRLDFNLLLGDEGYWTCDDAFTGLRFVVRRSTFPCR